TPDRLIQVFKDELAERVEMPFGGSRPTTLAEAIKNIHSILSSGLEQYPIHVDENTRINAPTIQMKEGKNFTPRDPEALLEKIGLNNIKWNRGKSSPTSFTLQALNRAKDGGFTRGETRTQEQVYEEFMQHLSNNKGNFRIALHALKNGIKNS